MTAVKGRDVKLYIQKPDLTFKLVACAVGVSMNVEAEEIPTTTVDSGIEDEYDSGAVSYTHLTLPTKRIV